MAPLPKRKHSTRRKGKRLAARQIKLQKLIICKNCQQLKIPHQVCKKCGK
ncbi:MAG: hypothetical protein ACD_7C00131G0001 [uncultured bacterium]|nr:MAG: hypothetical protein ACD_7C00131G0001 [uncultured bacterium]